MDKPYNPPPNGVMPTYQIGVARATDTGKWHVLIMHSCDLHGVHEYISNAEYDTEEQAHVGAEKEKCALVDEMTSRDGGSPLVISPPNKEPFYTPQASKHSPQNN